MNVAEEARAAAGPAVIEEEMARWDDLHIVAYIEVWGSPPPLFPAQHPLYDLDGGRGWFYLTAAGQTLYTRNRAQIDSLKAIQSERLEAHCTRQISEMRNLLSSSKKER